MEDKKDKFLIARVPAGMADKVKRKAKDNGKKISEWLRELVEQALK